MRRAAWSGGRLAAWDLAGRATEIEARVVVDTPLAGDRVFSLGGHDLALIRQFETDAGTAGDFGNWPLPLLDTRLTHDQATTTAQGTLAPWREGARVWLQVPASLSTPEAPLLNLSFSLATTPETLAATLGAPVVFHPAFSTSQGWTLIGLNALTADHTLPSLQRQGLRLYDQDTGQPWQPEAYSLTAPDGTAYDLDAAGKVTGIRFSDGAHWLVSDAGIAAIGNDPSARIDIQRDSQGRIALISGPVSDGNHQTTAYRYDAQGRMILARNLNSTTLGTPYGYAGNGQPHAELLDGSLATHLGAAVNWISTPDANRWQGTLQAGQTTSLAFTVRDSELASTVHTPGAQGAVIIAVQTTATDVNLSLQATDATLLGSATHGQTTTTLLRVTEAGLKLIRLGGNNSGNGAVDVRITLAGDLNRDGTVDGLDSQAWEAAYTMANAAYTPAADLDGDGLINPTDRQILYANHGWRANQAPMATGEMPNVQTHTDLPKTQSLATLAQDLEGDTVFWRILTATHGTAQLTSDGQTLIFTPAAGYAGNAGITLQADDGFATSAPIELTVHVSDAKLIAIHLAPLAALQVGQTALIQASVDFEDEKGVAITRGDYLSVTAVDLTGMGYEGSPTLHTDDTRDSVHALTTGPGLITVTRQDADGRLISTVAAINVTAASLPYDPNANLSDAEASIEAVSEPDYASEPFIVYPDVYPGTLSLTPGGQRQLKVHLQDENTGESIDIHTASQTVHAGSPESIETYLDPDTQLPLLDPDTGEVRVDPDTGEILLDPNTGETIEFVIPALPPVYSGTRYFVSDARIATVSEDGLITAHAAGSVTISIVHLASVTGYYGELAEQAIGQTDILLSVTPAQLTDDDPDTPAPQGIEVSKETGGVVSADTGETVLIGAGALAEDSVVSIRRIAVQNIEAATGLAAPAAGILQAIGAFNPDLGAQPANAPLQLVIPLQGGIQAEAGEEVLFFRKGQIPTPDGGQQDIWWLVDNGYIGTDAQGQAVARTASPPYVGLDSTGQYLVARRLPGLIGSRFDLGIGAGEWLSFGSLGFALSGGLVGVSIASEVIGILITSASSLSAGSYHFGVPQFVDVPLPDSETHDLEVSSHLPTVLTPWGNVSLPNLLSAEVDITTGTLKLTSEAIPADAFPATYALRALFANGSHYDVQKWDVLPQQIAIGLDKLRTADNKPIALGSVDWQLVRLIPTGILTGSGNLSESEPVEFAGNTLRLAPIPDMAAALTRTGVDLFRENGTVGQVSLIADMQGSYHDLDTLTGNKVQPIAFSGDLSRLYVGGNGKIYVIDLLSYQLIDTLPTQGGNIVSLAAVGNLLIVGEGRSYGQGESNARLLAIDINPGSPRYNKVISLKNTGIEASPYGVTGMTIGPDGKTLVVAVPQNPNSVSLGDKSKRGDILVFDLSTLNFLTGAIHTPIKADIPADGLSGKAPQSITATTDPNRYLIANIADYGRGLSTLTLTREDDNTVTEAKLNAIDLSQPSEAIRIDRLDIQRAQSAVLVEKNGVEYAIVSDDNYHFLDPYWKAMYEAPTFMQLSPYGPPTPIGGSAAAKKVAVGGKLGIVKDPFGKLGTPQYLGATLPLDGYGIQSLALSEDGKVLIGQLKGSYSSNILSADSLIQKPSYNLAWDVEALIGAVLAQPETDRLTQHITLPENTEQRIAWPAGEFYTPAGMVFDPDPLELSVTGNMGDVIEVDLKWLVADAMARQRLNLGPQSFQSIDEMAPEEQQALVAERENIFHFELNGAIFNLNAADLYTYIEGNSALRLVTASPQVVQQGVVVTTAIPYSRDGNDNLQTASFSKTGRMFMVPNLKQVDVTALRKGERVADKGGSLTFSYSLRGADGVWKSQIGTVRVAAKDYAATGQEKFFGDRPLENPGYSEFKLKGGVGVNQANDVLDVYRVEQRLKYLGFGSFEKQQPFREISVNGIWNNNTETSALRAFYGMTHYTYSTAASPGEPPTLPNVKGYTWANINAAKRVLPGPLDANTNLGWLSAYNAPHLVNLYQALGIPGTGVYDRLSTTHDYFLRGGDHEEYATSWMYDLLLAWEAAQRNLASLTPQQQAATLIGPSPLPESVDPSTPSHTVARLNGATRPQGGLAPNPPNYPASHNNGGHSLGMGLDWGFTKQFVRPREINNTALNVNYNGQNYSLPNITQGWTSGGWSVANALSAINRVANANPDIPNEERALRNFLSLYNVTQSDGNADNRNGSWEEIAITNGTQAQKDKIRAALFGNGTQTQPLIQNVWIGGAAPKNEWQRSRAALRALGIHNVNLPSHHNHYHIDFGAPTRLSITQGQNLMADAATIPGASGGQPGEHFHATLHDLALELAGEWGLSENDMDMYFPPDLESGKAPMVIVAAASQAKEKAVGVCELVDDFTNFAFGTDARGYLSEGKDPMEFDISRVPFKMLAIVRQPAHGRLTLHDSEPDGYGVYRPDKGYYGKDRVEAIVSIGKDVVRVVYHFVVVPGNVDDMIEADYDKLMKKRCPKGPSWKISGASTDPVSDAASANFATSLESLLSGSAQLAFADLPGGAVGSTSGTNISLDIDAAGYGWFLDPTPDANEEFLPTANPNEWQAKPGSEAASHMDLLSVFWHEYGHVLGLDHSADANNFMAATLQPGMRRLPTAEEFAQLAALATPAENTNPTPDTPWNPNLPTGASLSALLIGRLRSSQFGGWTPVFDSVQSLAPQPARQPEYQVTANPTFTPLTTPATWAPSGDVSFTNTTATLRETATAQTRLNQLFVLNEGDRTLRFTLADLQLDDASSAPDDAFEVALIDANTGLSLLGGTGLSHSDAFLNLQADGTLRLADGVTSTLNPDGSRSFEIDLSTLTPGTVASLSFDLIGFGHGAAATGSQLTLRDLRLGQAGGANQAPTAAADSAQLAEDGGADIVVLANDADPEGGPLRVELLTAPAHGTAAVNLDGSLAYTPEADYFGPDSLTYRVVDVAGAASGPATVSLTVTPVNDAPVAVADLVLGDEDGILSGNVLDNDRDVDGDALRVSLETAPAHGCFRLAADGGFQYQPHADWWGEDTFSYRVSDGQLDSVGSVTLRIAPVNDAPEARADAYRLDGGPLVVAAAHGLLGNDRDRDGDALTARLIQGPTHGRLDLAPDGGFSYTPEAGYRGSDGFTYRAEDGQEGGQGGVDPTLVQLIADGDPFQVTAFEQTDSGFHLAFNHLIDTGVLNLYSGIDDAPSSPMGTADLTLADAAGNRVRGNLVLDADGLGATYLKSDGVLSPGNYTLRLSSRADGWRDQSGQLLDGDGDGTAGDDYTRSLTVAAGGGAIVSIG